MQYKRATNRFILALKSKVPSHIYIDGKTKYLMDSVDYLVDAQDMFIASTMMHDLKLALRVRKRVAQSIEGGGDEKHAHFNSVLAYCWGKLLHKWKAQRNEPARTREQTPAVVSSDEDRFVNRFSVLSDDDIEEDEEDEEFFPIHENPRPSIQAPELQDITVEDLINGDERQAVILFLISVDELMGFNIEHYSKLKLAFRSYRLERYSPAIIVEQLMESAVSSNFAIAQVSMLEQQLMVDYPHLNTIYRVLALYAMPFLMEEVAKEVKACAARASEFDAQKDAIAFVGDCLEAGFRSESDPENRSSTLAADFCSYWGMTTPSATLEEVQKSVQFLVMVEAPLVKQKAEAPEFFQQIEGIPESQKPSSWLRAFSSLGRGRNLVHTIRLLQALSNVIGTNNGILPPAKAGWFGRRWDEQGNMAQTIAGDMDDFLMVDVLPVLIAMCSKGVLAADLPLQEELLPFFVHLRSFCSNVAKPVSLALAFGIHTLLVSVFEVQGNGDVDLLGSTAKKIFDNYMDQLEAVSINNETPRSRHWTHNLEQMNKIRWLVVSPRKATAPQVMRAVWNPMTAGCFLLYTSYFLNLDCGTTMIDSFAQLRIVLHLYNALRQVGVIKEQLLFLETLHDKFRTCKAIWEGSALPKKGVFAKRFLISFGTSVKEAQRKSEQIKMGLKGGQHASPSQQLSSGSAIKKMTPINPHEISKSFRRICLRDFSDVVDNYHTERHGKDARANVNYEQAVRANDTLDAMEDEQDLLALNLTKVGETLNQFIDFLFKVLEWKPIIDKIVREMDHTGGRRMTGAKYSYTPWEDENMERQAQAWMFAERILGALDFMDTPWEVQSLVRTGAALQTFFSRIDPTNVLWYTPLVEE